VARMLQLNSTSILAYVAKGDIESAEGGWAAAVASYQTAMQLLDSRSDTRLRERYVGEFQWLQLREDVVMKLERARSRIV
jgi:hypothetical protein